MSDRTDFFNAGMTDLAGLYEDERLIRVRTDNPLDNDNLCLIVTIDETESDEFESKLKSALRRKYGHRGPSIYRGWEDVTDIYFDENGNVLD